MDLETFFTILYVLVDDWYNEYVAPHKPKRGGPKPKMSDSEVLAVALAGQWQVGVPWRSERGLVRYMQAHGKGMFPGMLRRSAFNLRVRRLWGAFILLQQAVADLLETPEDVYVCADCEPIPAFSSGQEQHDRAHWMWESTKGHGGNWGKFFFGDHLLAIVSRNGAVTGWMLGTAYIQDRWLLEAVLSARAGHPQLVGPPHSTHEARSKRPIPPVGHIGPIQAAGRRTTKPYLTDPGFNGIRWLSHWRESYGAVIITAPPPNVSYAWSKEEKRWLSSHRQIVDTVFSFLDGVFGIKRLNAHSRWGQYTRIAAKIAAFNIGLFINQMLGRPPMAFATLIC